MNALDKKFWFYDFLLLRVKLRMVAKAEQIKLG
jgi:hypothetical protein